MTENPVKFPCGDITLEGIFHIPDGEGPFPVVIVCHPHPLYGGDMYHPVVYNVCTKLAAASKAALRFNFRGVGESGGTYAEGIGEQEDVKAAIAFVLSQPNIDAKRLGLAGYSFGASTIVPVAVVDARVQMLALISPVFESAQWDALNQYRKPKILITGEDDYYISTRLFEKMAQNLPQTREYHIIKNADHFWNGFEAEVARKVVYFFSEEFLTMKIQLSEILGASKTNKKGEMHYYLNGLFNPGDYEITKNILVGSLDVNTIEDFDAKWLRKGIFEKDGHKFFLYYDEDFGVIFIDYDHSEKANPWLEGLIKEAIPLIQKEINNKYFS